MRQVIFRIFRCAVRVSIAQCAVRVSIAQCAVRVSIAQCAVRVSIAQCRQTSQLYIIQRIVIIKHGKNINFSCNCSTVPQDQDFHFVILRLFSDALSAAVVLWNNQYVRKINLLKNITLYITG
jgi:hypothetical protein